MKFKITKAGILNFFKITLPVILFMLLILEVVFRTVIPAGQHPYFELYDESGYVIGKYNQKNGAEGIKTIGALAGTKAHWLINNHGWNSAIDYQYERKDSSIKRIAIIGDSYVESLNLDIEKSFPALMNQELAPNYEVYSFGIGGSPLSQYLHFCRYVTELYQPDAYIFMLANNDIDESWSHLGDYRNLLIGLAEQDSIIEFAPQFYQIEQGKFASLAKKSALVRYMYFNLQIFRITRLLRFSFNNEKYTPSVVNPNEIRSNNNMIKVVSNYILNEIEATTKDHPVLFVQDGDRENIYKGRPNDGKIIEISSEIKLLCDSLDYGFIDLFPIFESDYKVNGKKLNTAADYHWNAYAHKIIADTLSTYSTEIFIELKVDSSAIE